MAQELSREDENLLKELKRLLGKEQDHLVSVELEAGRDQDTQQHLLFANASFPLVPMEQSKASAKRNPDGVGRGVLTLRPNHVLIEYTLKNGQFVDPCLNEDYFNIEQYEIEVESSSHDSEEANNKKSDKASFEAGGSLKGKMKVPFIGGAEGNAHAKTTGEKGQEKSLIEKEGQARKTLTRQKISGRRILSIGGHAFSISKARADTQFQIELESMSRDRPLKDFMFPAPVAVCTARKKDEAKPMSVSGAWRCHGTESFLIEDATGIFSFLVEDVSPAKKALYERALSAIAQELKSPSRTSVVEFPEESKDE